MFNPEKFEKKITEGIQVVQKDKEYVSRMEERFAQEKAQHPEKERIDKIAAIFEYIFYQEAESSEWLGGQVETIKTSKYDDFKNGVDLVAEFKESETSASHLGLAIDVTTSDWLWKKFERPFRMIHSLRQLRLQMSCPLPG